MTLFFSEFFSELLLVQLSTMVIAVAINHRVYFVLIKNVLTWKYCQYIENTIVLTSNEIHKVWIVVAKAAFKHPNIPLTLSNSSKICNTSIANSFPSSIIHKSHKSIDFSMFLVLKHSIILEDSRYLLFFKKKKHRTASLQFTQFT